jgi:benzoylformate decarboxylase
MLRSAGVDRVFGNPGTTELPLLDEFVSLERIAYHLVLQEGVAVGMADGYAQSTGRVGVLSLHTTGGVANAMGLVYNASRAGTPLLVLSGQQDTRLTLQEPFLYSDMVRWVRALVKWADEVTHPHDLPRALRRALSEALAPPTGPVFLALPIDVLRAEGVPAEDVAPRLALAVSPDPNGLAAAAAALREARTPLIIAGDRVGHAGGEAELLALAEETGWPVALEPYPTRFVFPNRHRLARGALPPFAAAVRSRLSAHDAVLAVGCTPFEHFLYDGAAPLPPGTRLIHLDLAPAYIGRNHPVVVGVPGDLRAGLTALRSLVRPQRVGTIAAHANPVASGPAYAATSADDTSRPHREARTEGGPYDVLMDAIAAVLETEDVLVEEAISGRRALLDRIPRSLPGTFFGQKGGTIGWGFPAAMGIKLAHPDRRVLAVVGDGSLLMEAQGLWTAAHDRIGIAIVVIDNRGYTILKQGLATLAGQAAQRGLYPATDVLGVDLVGLARSFGVGGERIVAASPDGGWTSQLQDAVGRALVGNEPYLIDVVMDVPVRPLT